MQFSKSLVGAVAITMALSTIAMARSRTPTLREQEEAACSNDAMTLCSDVVPDEAKTTACMTQKRAQLSAGCAKMFETETKAKKRR